MLRSNAFLFMVVWLACASFAGAQPRSLADMTAGEKFVSWEGGFEVRLPNDARIWESDEFGSTLAWNLKEGVVTINYDWDGFEPMGLPPATSRAAKIKAFVDEIKKGYVLRGDTVGETHSSAIGGIDFNFFPITMGKQSGVSAIFVEERRSIWILVLPSEKVPGSAELIGKAIETFRLLPKKR